MARHSLYRPSPILYVTIKSTDNYFSKTDVVRKSKKVKEQKKFIIRAYLFAFTQIIFQLYNHYKADTARALYRTTSNDRFADNTHL